MRGVQHSNALRLGDESTRALRADIIQRLRSSRRAMERARSR